LLSIAAPPVDIDGIREPVSGSLLYGNNIISVLEEALGLLSSRWERLDGAQALRMLPSDTKLQVQKFF
jgi:hypothetical protein